MQRRGSTRGDLSRGFLLFSTFRVVTHKVCVIIGITVRSKFFPLLFTLLVLGVIPLHAEKIVIVAGGGGAERDAPATQCALHEPFCVEFNPAGEMVIAEMEHGNRVLKVNAQGMLRVIAGSGGKGYAGDGGPATAASFSSIHNFAVLPNGDLLLADSFSNALRRIDAKSGIIETIAGDGNGFGGDNGPAAKAQFSTLIQISLDPTAAQLYLADIGNRRIRRIDLKSWIITTVAGNGQSAVPSDGAEAVSAPLVDPRAVVADAAAAFMCWSGAVMHCDTSIPRAKSARSPGPARKDSPAMAVQRSPQLSTGRIRHDGSRRQCAYCGFGEQRHPPLFAEDGACHARSWEWTAGAGGIGGSPLECELRRPHGVTVGRDGALYIADSYNDRILKIVP